MNGSHFSYEPSVRYVGIDDGAVSIYKRSMQSIKELESMRGKNVILYDEEDGYVVAKSDDVIRAIATQMCNEIRRKFLAPLFGDEGSNRAEEFRPGRGETAEGSEGKGVFEEILRVWAKVSVNPAMYITDVGTSDG